MKRKAAWKSGVTLAAFSLVALAASSASATIIIGVQEAGVNGGAITTVYSGGTGGLSGSYGTFSGNIETGIVDDLPDILGSTSTNQVTTGGPGTLNVFVTETDLTAPLGAAVDFLSSFTTNALPAGWSATESTFLDSADGVFGGAPLASFTFNAIGVQQLASTLSTGAGPYSVTQEYTINATGPGTALSTIDLSATPEPATWALMLLGIGAVGAAQRSRRQARQRAAFA